jgi:hypothetical protein
MVAEGRAAGLRARIRFGFAQGRLSLRLKNGYAQMMSID